MLTRKEIDYIRKRSKRVSLENRNTIYERLPKDNLEHIEEAVSVMYGGGNMSTLHKLIRELKFESKIWGTGRGYFNI